MGNDVTVPPDDGRRKSNLTRQLNKRRDRLIRLAEYDLARKISGAKALVRIEYSVRQLILDKTPSGRQLQHRDLKRLSLVIDTQFRLLNKVLPDLTRVEKRNTEATPTREELIAEARQLGLTEEIVFGDGHAINAAAALDGEIVETGEPASESG